MLNPTMSAFVAPSHQNIKSGQANSLYASARNRGQRRQFWSSLRGRSRCLLRLASVEAQCRVKAHFDAGLHTVAIDQIRGSEGRSTDFDCDFYPLRAHNQARWLGVARARQEGKELPPVSLVQIGEIYFVRDGNHRISVARALGQQEIEAQVVAWQVAGPLPWEALSPAGQLSGLAAIPGRLQRTWVQLVTPIRLALGSPVAP